MADRKSIVHVKVRLRKALLARLKKAAAKNDRSFNDELNQRVAESFSRADVEALVYRAARAAASASLAQLKAEAGRLGAALGRDEYISNIQSVAHQTAIAVLAQIYSGELLLPDLARQLPRNRENGMTNG